MDCPITNALLVEDTGIDRAMLLRRSEWKRCEVVMLRPWTLNLDHSLVVGFWSLVVLLSCSQSSILLAQPASTNRVLQLDGSGSYIELPPDIFEHLDDATVECWVRWDKFDIAERVFDFGSSGRELYLSAPDNPPVLKFLIAEPDGPRHRVEVGATWRPRCIRRP